MKPRRTPCAAPPTPTPAAPQAPPQIERLRIPPAKTPTPCPAKAPTGPAPKPSRPAPRVVPGPPKIPQTGLSLPLIEQCDSCRFWADNYMNETGVAGGFCRRLPPTRHGFPEVWGDSWCGSYQFNESLFEKPPQNESRCCAFGGAPQVPAPAAISRQENADNAAMHCNESHFVRN